MSLTFSLLVSPFGMENKKKEEDIKQSTDGLVIVRKRDISNKFYLLDRFNVKKLRTKIPSGKIQKCETR
jgi:hypothetical protein